MDGPSEPTVPDAVGATGEEAPAEAVPVEVGCDGADERTGDDVEECILFPGKQCVQGTEKWVTKANEMLRGAEVQKTMSIDDIEELMLQFRASYGDTERAPGSTGTCPAEAPERALMDLNFNAPLSAEDYVVEEERAAVRAADADAADASVPTVDDAISDQSTGSVMLYSGGRPMIGLDGDLEEPTCLDDCVEAPPSPHVPILERKTDVFACPEIVVSADEFPLTIVGDIHGQLSDLLQRVLGPVLRGESPPSRYLFLGDYVDRGAHGLDVFVLLVLLRVSYPNLVTLLRGNHEDAQVSRVYGFWSECGTKYSRTELEDPAAWCRANETFPGMSVAAVIRHAETGRRVFCCHGGLSPALLPKAAPTDLFQGGDAPEGLEPEDIIGRALRKKYGESRLRGSVNPWTIEPVSPTTQTTLDGLLWSDPIPQPPDRSILFQGSERGCGYGWTPSASSLFCQKNGFDFICRAHQMVSKGFLWQHDGRVLTLFSASNYCGVAGNDGAVLTIGPEWWPQGETPSCSSYPPPMDESAPRVELGAVGWGRYFAEATEATEADADEEGDADAEPVVAAPEVEQARLSDCFGELD